MKTKKFTLEESEIPRQWYNIVADMTNKPQPMLNPLTQKPVTAEELYPLFAKECVNEELNQKDAFIDIPEEVWEQYKIWRPTPLVRAYDLEKALDTPAHIYFKNESVSPVGSHKLNSALPQVYFAKKDGVTNLTTETGAGQWGTAMSYACRVFGIELAVFMVKVSYEQKPYRRSMMKVFGAQVIASPSMTTEAGRKILTKMPNHQGSLGTAISEAVDLCRTTPEFCKYALGSTMNHVMLHQTIIGEEARIQMEKAGEYPDVVIACFGGGSNFAGISFPFLRDKLREGKSFRAIAVEPSSCPKFSKGEFRYDYGDEAGYTPLIPMYTLGHDFRPSNTHAGGLRYHGSGAIPSQLKKDGLIEVADVSQLEAFDAAVLFARTEGIIPAPESSHAIAVAIREAKLAKERGEKKTILFNLSGHGWIDMSAYDMYFSGSMKE
ncbi:MAG TPA: TrpB-like pyridoxal phosphate-dependent enzyme [Porphyromonadaceae bacterium]|nr:TrpB-like pyridoxal phosphate-dependent enzyme [Porphyromonadaceae bacterium]